MLQLIIEILPFAVFVVIGVFAFAEPASPRKAPGMTTFPRQRTFCGFADGGAVILADPDGKPAIRQQ